ncbi:hypothetical protein VMCG_05363 [Cytospora schulzeri]|uniref:Clr5 domain-containing protein n=1 Tax=Cytospora schulzeri TaxID=448051 RepID=A0A423WKH5_9PEZI|nr:hypothetical protein VMCG_05363 [Valsa malicola]
MASRSKTITQAQWEHHKPAILGLYHGGLPLRGKQDARNLIQVMKDEHNFTASPAQYEAQFRRWESPKNLKQNEWKLVLAKIDELGGRGLKARPKVSGQVMDADRINRARRRYMKHRDSGKVPRAQSPTSCQVMPWRPRSLSPVNDGIQDPVSVVPRYLVDEEDSVRLARLLLGDAVSVMRRRGLAADVTALPTCEGLLDTLEDQLLVETAQDDFGQFLYSMSGGDTFTDRFVGLFLFSIANNFAGLESIPAEAIMRFIGQHEHIRSRILNYLKQTLHSLSHALAETMFKAAIEAGDSTVTRFILHNHLVDPNTVVVLDSRNLRLTPVERAAGLRRLDVTKCLVEADADVNKTYEKTSYYDRGALECAIGKWGDYVPVDLNLVDVILDSGAIVRADLLAAAIRWGDEGVVNRLMSRLSPAEHRHCFDFEVLADAAQYLGSDLSLRVVRQLIHACQDLHDNQCLGPNQKQLRVVMTHAAKKANIELVKLLLLLIDQDQETLDHGLAAAVSSGSRDMVHLLLNYGANIGASIPKPPTTRKRSRHLRKCVTTPLAEAIRASDNELILFFEQKGALAKIIEDDHLEAALYAVAETGNLAYLQKLLQLVPSPNVGASTCALLSAIEANHEDIAMALIAVGATVDSLFIHRLDDYSPLTAALRVASSQLVSTLLEIEAHCKFDDPGIILHAIQRGDIAIIKDLVFMGADLNFNKNNTWYLKRGHGPRSPLAAAVLTGDSILVEYLLEHGADPANSEALQIALRQKGEVLSILFREFRKRYPCGLPGFGGGVLQCALELSNSTLLHLCLDAKLDVNSFSESENGVRAEMNALGFLIRKYSGKRQASIVELLDAGGDVNAIASRTWQP